MVKTKVNTAHLLIYNNSMGQINFHMPHFSIVLTAGTFLLASCAAPPPLAPPQLEPETKASTSQKLPPAVLQTENEVIASDIDKALEAYQEGQALLNKDDIGTDEIGAIIWDLEKTDNATQILDKPAEIVTFEELIPEGRDPSLEEEALDAAFAMLRVAKDGDDTIYDKPFTFDDKQEGQTRIGVFVPRTGPKAIYGMQVIHGIEMALFQLNDPQIELLYFDTADEAVLGGVVKNALVADIDIAIGPLFSANATKAYPYFAREKIPVLSLSNNARIARSGLWVLGLLPEQQIDALIAESILKGHDRIAILSDYSDYGSTLTGHVVSRLEAFGIAPAMVMTVDGSVSADDEGLMAKLVEFSHYKPLEDDELISDIPAPYDSVILAGGASFVLKVAPLLSYYDLGPDRVSYLGTDLWASAGLLGEPSLQGAYVSTIDPNLRAAFSKRYNGLYLSDETQDTAASFLSQLGFDAMAIAASATKYANDLASTNAISQQAQKPQSDEQSSQALSLTDGDKTDASLIAALAKGSRKQSPLVAQLVSEAGFKGYTGAFRLLADGRNNRTYQLFQVNNGQLIKATMTPKELVE